MFFTSLLAQSLNQDVQPVEVASNADNLNTNFSNIQDLAYISISWVNAFTIAFTIFYCILYLIDFFENRMFFNSGGELGNEVYGVKSIKNAINIWLRYFPCLLLFTIFAVLRASPVGLIFALFALLGYAYKLYLDVYDLTFVLGYFGWSDKFGQAVRSILRKR